MSHALRFWARKQPTAIIHMLPQRLWQASGPEISRVLWNCARRPGTPNSQLLCHDRDENEPLTGVPVPVLGLDARWLGSWVSVISGTAAGWVSGMALMTGRSAEPIGLGRYGTAAPAAEMSAGERVTRFAAAASPQAMKLATYLAAVPLSLPVMRLVQRAMLPESVPAHLAEVYLGGLLCRTDDPALAKQTAHYDFHPGVRDLLLSRLTRSDALRAMGVVSDQLGLTMSIGDRRGGLTLATREPERPDHPARHADVSVPDIGEIEQSYSHDRRPPAIWGALPSRNLRFTGRQEELTELRMRLQDGGQAVLACALHGMGGVGKTQIATEYAYRYRDHYDLVWWIPAQQDTGIRASLSELCHRMEKNENAGAGEPWARALEMLRTGTPCACWLVIFDNADRPEDLGDLLPQGAGHVIITSRNPVWARRTEAIDVGVLRDDESVELLRRHRSAGQRLSASEAALLTQATGALPIALVQAAEWQASTGMSVEEHLRRFEDVLPLMLVEDLPPGYPVPLLATWQMAIDRLRGDDPTAVELLELCSLFAPEPIHRSLLRSAAGPGLTGRLGDAFRDPVVLSRAIKNLGRYALARVDNGQETVEVHRLIQAAVRRKGAMTEDRRDYLQHVIHLLLLHACPGDPADMRGWPQRRRIQPHLISSEALDCEMDEVRRLVVEQVVFLKRSGDSRGARKLAELAWRRWSTVFGSEHADSVAVLRHLTGLPGASAWRISAMK